MPSPNSSMLSSAAAAKVDDPIAATTAGARRRPSSRWPSAGSARLLLRSLLREAAGHETVRAAGCGEEMLNSDWSRHEKEGTLVLPRQARSRPDPDLRLDDRAGGTLWPSPSNSMF
jgi:hypothetical protein